MDEVALKKGYVNEETRLAPIRYIIITHHLELQAELYVVCLVKQTWRVIAVNFDRFDRSTDSTSVLQLLKSARRKEEVFVVLR